LSDRYEVAIGTDPTRPDSDNDGLADYKELRLGTDPMNADTDGDGIKDGVHRAKRMPKPLCDCGERFCEEVELSHWLRE